MAYAAPVRSSPLLPGPSLSCVLSPATARAPTPPPACCPFCLPLPPSCPTLIPSPSLVFPLLAHLPPPPSSGFALSFSLRPDRLSIHCQCSFMQEQPSSLWERLPMATALLALSRAEIEWALLHGGESLPRGLPMSWRSGFSSSQPLKVRHPAVVGIPVVLSSFHRRGRALISPHIAAKNDAALACLLFPPS